MFGLFKQKKDYDIVIEMLHNKETYPVTAESLARLYDLVKDNPVTADGAIGIRKTHFKGYRNLYDLQRMLVEYDRKIKFNEPFLEDINRQVTEREIYMDTWLVSDENFRLDYYVFINGFTSLIEGHIALLKEQKEKLKRTPYATLENSMYTLHFDALAIAENHLLYVHHQPQ